MNSPNETSTSLDQKIPCEVCKTEISIYRCPACFTRTCSLTCCLAHKQQKECSGKRDRTAFVPLHQFSNSTLASDFHFLEDVLARSDRGKRLIKDLGVKTQSSNKRRKTEHGNSGENVDVDVPLHPLSRLQLASASEKVSREECERNTINDNTEQNEVLKDCNKNEKIDTMASVKQISTPVATMTDQALIQYPKYKQRLVQKARERNVRLLLMPQGMQRHILNKSTKYDAKNDIFFWKVEITFHLIAINNGDDESKPTRYRQAKKIITLERISERDTIYQHLSKEFAKQVSHAASSDSRTFFQNFRQGTTHEMKGDTVGLMKRLGEPYKAISKVSSKTFQPKSVYNRVDLKQSLRNVLKDMAIIEFPSIEIVRKEDAKHFSVMIEEL